MTQASVKTDTDLTCVSSDLAAEMTRWMSFLRTERRLSPKTLEAYERERAAYEERLSEALVDGSSDTEPAEVAGRGTQRE